jgi:hypothetical protein
MMPQEQTFALAHRMGRMAQTTKSVILQDLAEDVYTIADSDYFVGTYSSNFGCIAYLLGVYLKYKDLTYEVPRAVLLDPSRELPATASFPPPPMTGASLDFDRCKLMGVPLKRK